MASPFPPKPAQLYRITDNFSYIQFDPNNGFNWPTSTQFIPFNHRIGPVTVAHHLAWKYCKPESGLFSVCGHPAKADREINWRRRDHHANIQIFTIDTSSLHWEEIPWNDGQGTMLQALCDNNLEVMIFKAWELTSKFGLSADNALYKPEVFAAAKDEWIVLEWIPTSMIVGHQRITL